MLKLLFKTTAYYIIWQKFKKQIILILASICIIGVIDIIYNDLFQVMRIDKKDNLGTLLFFKWFLIFLIILFNIYVLRKTKIDFKDEYTKESNKEFHNNKIYSKTEQEILTKKKILTTTDLILKKYEK